MPYLLLTFTMTTNHLVMFFLFHLVYFFNGKKSSFIAPFLFLIKFHILEDGYLDFFHSKLPAIKWGKWWLKNVLSFRYLITMTRENGKNNVSLQII
jgi:hypothetical protein